MPTTIGWTACLAAGWLRSDAPHPANGSTAVGTELLAEARWVMGATMALEIGASVLLAGDYFKPSAAAPAPATSTRSTAVGSSSSDSPGGHGSAIDGTRRWFSSWQLEF